MERYAKRSSSGLAENPEEGTDRLLTFTLLREFDIYPLLFGNKT